MDLPAVEYVEDTEPRFVPRRRSRGSAARRWILGAPQSRFSSPMRRIRMRISAVDLRPAARACTRAPSPVEPKSSSVPAHHGVRLHNDERLAPPRPDAAQNGPKQPVDGAQLRSRMFSFEPRELLTQGEDLQLRRHGDCGRRPGLRLGLREISSSTNLWLLSSSEATSAAQIHSVRFTSGQVVECASLRFRLKVLATHSSASSSGRCAQIARVKVEKENDRTGNAGPHLAEAHCNRGVFRRF